VSLPPRHLRLVADPAALEDLLQAVRGAPLVALDTESNSFHAYRERVCLLQISTRDQDFILDPLAVRPEPLGPLLAEGREVVLHGADYDVRCLKREWGWALPRIFDTMAAARRLGRAGLGLTDLVASQFGARLSKEFQRSDWGRRPLTDAQIHYASLDTHYLLPIYDQLRAELQERGLLDEARKEFDKIAAVEPRPRVFDPEGWRRIKAARTLEPASRAVLRALWVAREQRASEVDRPPFKVLAEPTMVEIARRRPRTPEELARVPGVTTVLQRRLGDIIQGALQAGSGV